MNLIAILVLLWIQRQFSRTLLIIILLLGDKLDLENVQIHFILGILLIIFRKDLEGQIFSKMSCFLELHCVYRAIGQYSSNFY